MKKINKYITLAAIGLAGIASGCSDFGDTNIDPENLNEGNIHHNLLFTAAQVQALGSDWDVWRTGIIYASTMMQHTTSVSWNHVFYTYNEAYNAAFWDALYSGERGVIRDIITVTDKWKGDRKRENDYQMARILKAYIFHRMTDLYGDIPYSEAGRIKDGFASQAYDTQESIYDDLLRELDQAQRAIRTSEGSQLGNADLYFNGNPDKWKKFANSLILRIAMRLSKADQEKAQQWVKTAVANGIIDRMADNAILFHRDGTPADDSAEPYGKIFSESDPQAFFLSEYFINLLKETRDPRLPLIASVCRNPEISYMQDGYERGNPDPAVQKGMPVGYDTGGGQWDISTAPGYPGETFRSHYSVPSRYTYADPQAPTMIVTCAQNHLLLAEAAHRGWLQGTAATATAKAYYESGVRAAMEQFALYANARNLYAGHLTPEAIDRYLAVNPFDERRALELINTQYYITTFCDEYETFANWRRSGYPLLEAVDKGYPNCVTGGTIPRRFTYPSEESHVNEANYRRAVERLRDGDRMTSRLWWDTE